MGRRGSVMRMEMGRSLACSGGGVRADSLFEGDDGLGGAPDEGAREVDVRCSSKDKSRRGSEHPQHRLRSRYRTSPHHLTIPKLIFAPRSTICSKNSRPDPSRIPLSRRILKY
jgi:hypothetical protein